MPRYSLKHILGDEALKITLNVLKYAEFFEPSQREPGRSIGNARSLVEDPACGHQGCPWPWKSPQLVARCRSPLVAI